MDDPAEALEHVEVDTDPRAEAADWAADELIAGRSPDDVAAELVTHGWSADRADEVVEYARQATRRARGVVTRDDVAGMVAAKYRGQTTGIIAFLRFPSHVYNAWKLSRKLRGIKKSGGK